MPLVDSHAVSAVVGTPAPIRILIVDDQVVARAAVRSALDRIDGEFVVIEADNGNEALEIMRNARVDIIFCDVQLPGISGPEALVHAFGASDHRPFMVLMSGMHSDAVRELGRKAGVYEFMLKPFGAGEVINAIQAYRRLQQLTRVLLIDDSATARKLMTRILARSQFRIELHEAASGEEALAFARRARFDVIFCDFNMPGTRWRRNSRQSASGQSGRADRPRFHRAAIEDDPLGTVRRRFRFPEEAVRRLRRRRGPARRFRDPAAPDRAADPCDLLG
jgi:Response regulator containing a CheY-like receiver domain and an HTH DNA-binding domain